MVTWVTASLVGAIFSGAAVSGSDVPTVGLTIAVDLADSVKVGPRDLAEAEAWATASYRAVGIDVIWGRRGSGTSGLSATNIIRVRVVLVPHENAEAKCAAERLSNQVAGIAMSGVQDERGRIAYIFYHRIERMALANGAPVARGLGHVMAHEIGHLLLGVNSHSRDGLMQPNWLPRETRLQTLTRTQIETVRRRFAAPADAAHLSQTPP